jgi:hypothetical protein
MVTDEFKQDAVAFFAANGRPLAQSAREPGIQQHRRRQSAALTVRGAGWPECIVKAFHGCNGFASQYICG